MSTPEIIGIPVTNPLRGGQLFRATWFLNTWWPGTILPGIPSEATLQRVYDRIEPTGYVYPVSARAEILTGDRAMVVDLGLSSGGVGLPVSELAGALDHLDAFTDLVRLELISVDLANNAESRRGELETANSDQADKHPGLLGELEKLGTVLKWTVIGVALTALLYLGIRGGELLKKK